MIYTILDNFDKCCTIAYNKKLAVTLKDETTTKTIRK